MERKGHAWTGIPDKAETVPPKQHCLILLRRRKMRSKWFALFSVVVVASMLLAACGTAKPPVAVAAANDLRVNATSFPDTLDPQKASFVNEIGHLHLVYEGLTRLNTNLETVPGAADKWEFNADATQLTFHIRGGLKYSDGSLLNAKRFEYSLFRLIDPTVAGDYAGSLDVVPGAIEYRTADPAKTSADDMAKLKAAVAIQALDSKGVACTGYDQADCNTLVLKFKAPAPYMATVLSMWVAYPAKEELIKAGGDNWYLDAKNQIGNGPFVMDKLEASQESHFIPSPTYWRGAAKINIDYKYITDSAVAFAAYKNNEFDIVPLAAEDLKTVEADTALNAQKMIYPGSCTFAIFFTPFKEPFTDKKVREAFILASDRNGWVNTVQSGLGSPTLTWIPKGYPGYDPNETRYATDAALAKTTLADSDWVKAGKPLDVKLTFSDSPRNRTRFEFLAANYKDALGVDVKLDPVEPTAYTALTKDKSTIPQVFYLGWCADYPDPQDWLSIYWMSTSEYAKRYGYVNLDLDKLMQAGDSEIDPAKRAKDYADAQTMLIGDATAAMMSNNVNAYMVKPYVKGIATTPQDALFPGDVDPLTITIEK
jgi:oligopeptide transport system substrate-binding protein